MIRGLLILAAMVGVTVGVVHCGAGTRSPVPIPEATDAQCVTIVVSGAYDAAIPGR